MLDRLLKIAFYILFFLTPLLWTSFSYELFEYNKMILVYFLTTIIFGVWLLKMISSKSLILKRTVLDIPLLLFLLANILSTLFSIDPHLSIWGYYSRSNGGLLSLFSYIILYYALISNFGSKEVLGFLKSILVGGLFVSLWAIPEHFGASPSCLILTGNLNASCWVQDVQARVFSTFGQPNWLAAYLGMLIFPSLYFLLNSKTTLQKAIYLLLTTTYYLAFTFTFSRGATLGLLSGMVLFLILVFIPKDIFAQKTKILSFFKLTIINLFLSILAVYFTSNFGESILLSIIKIVLLSIALLTLEIIFLRSRAVFSNIKNLSNNYFLGATIATFIIINLLFGSSLTSFNLIAKYAPPTRPSLSLSTSSTTQLETGGTESGQIRLIVWRGALEIFKHYPLFGSGVETFAHSYYQFRPAEHNLVSEWDFLYNKAHNEFLNYLSTTGIFGFLSYIGIILTFIIWTIRLILTRNSSGEKPTVDTNYLLPTALLAGYISYLVQNFFGFSVVMTALLFFLFPAFAFVLTDSINPIKFPQTLSFLNFFPRLLYKRSFYPKILNFIIIFLTIAALFTIARYYYGDYIFNQGFSANEQGNPGRAYNFLTKALNLNPKEPLYQSELSYAAAGSAVALKDEDATLSAQLKTESTDQTEEILNSNPHNVSLHRTAVRTYYLLSALDPTYINKTLETLDKTITLAPTDPKLTYNKAVILSQDGKIKEAIQILEKTLELKPNYEEAHYALGLLYFEDDKKEKAVEQMREVIKITPDHKEAKEKLELWGAK